MTLQTSTKRMMLSTKALWKAYCQPRSWTTSEPRMSPAAAPMANVPLMIPWAPAIFSLGKVSVIIASPSGTMAKPTPWMARAKRRKYIEGEKPAIPTPKV